MANTTAVESWDKRFAQGKGHWMSDGEDFWNSVKNFCEDHTHTGTTADGSTLPAAALDNAAKTGTAFVRLNTDNDDATFEYPVFIAPSSVTITGIHWIPGSQVVGADTNNFTLTVVNKGTAGAGTAQVASLTMNAAAGTVPALGVRSLGAITNASLTAGQALTFAKGTAGTGLRLPASWAAVSYRLSD